jgi:hypothetical protein
MADWAHATWNFLHTQSFYLDLHEHHGLDAQQAFVDLLLALPGQLPCSECRPHLNAFFRADPPPEPSAYEPEDYVFAKYLWRLHNSVNRRLGKPEPTFAAVVDYYVNERQDVVCTTTLRPEEQDETKDEKKDDRHNRSGQNAQQEASTMVVAHDVQSNTQIQNNGCGIPDIAVPVVIFVAVMIFVVIVLCATLEFIGRRRQSFRQIGTK